jgi:hypothetical protein
MGSIVHTSKEYANMVGQYDKLYAAVVMVILGLVTLFSPLPEVARLLTMLPLCIAAFVAERIL